MELSCACMLCLLMPSLSFSYSEPQCDIHKKKYENGLLSSRHRNGFENGRGNDEKTLEMYFKLNMWFFDKSAVTRGNTLEAEEVEMVHFSYPVGGSEGEIDDDYFQDLTTLSKHDIISTHETILYYYVS